MVLVYNWIVSTIGKHMIARQTLTSGRVVIRADKPAQLGVIVSGLQVVEASYVVVDIAGGMRAVRDRQDITNYILHYHCCRSQVRKG